MRARRGFETSSPKAAQMLNYSQSGISRMIGDLERDWKLNLLERGKKGVRLTSDGTRLMPYIKSVCSEYEKLCMQVDELNGSPVGTYQDRHIFQRCHSLAAEDNQGFSEKLPEYRV